MTIENPGITLRAARVNAGFKQDEAAPKLGVSVSTLQNYEKGKTIPNVRFMKKASEVYHFPEGQIFLPAITL